MEPGCNRMTGTEGRVYTVEVPLPPRELSPNTYRHWRAVSKAKKEYRLDCYVAFKAAAIPTMGRIRVSLDFYNGRIPGCDRYRPWDVGNAISSCKGLLDSLVDAGIVKDDSRRYMELGPVRIFGTKQEHGGRSCVDVTIEEV